MTQVRRAVLALGSNLGDPAANLQAGVSSLAATAGLRVAAVSPVYETEPVGGPPQPDYLNAVILLDSSLAARDLLARAQEIEDALGRVRRQRWGPRTLDIDVIAIDGETIDDSVLTLPHPRAHERAFVLAPWHDVDPAAELPGHGPVRELLSRLGLAGLRRRVDVVLEPR